MIHALVGSAVVVLAVSAGAADLSMAVDMYPLPGGGVPRVLAPDGTDSLWVVTLEPARLVKVRLPATEGAAPAFENVATPAELGAPTFVAPGRDRTVWLTGDKGVARLAGDGTFTVFPHAHVDAFGATVGPDGRLWFVFAKEKRAALAAQKKYVGRLSADLEGLDVIPIEGAGIEPTFLTAGPDGNIWGASGLFSKAALVRIKPDGDVAVFPRPSGSPLGIATGPDGNIWFTDGARDRVGRVAPASAEVTEFPVAPAGRPDMIAAGPDGVMWFTAGGNARVGRITVTGEVATIAVPGGGEPLMITAAADGNMWFGAAEPPRIGRVRIPIAPHR